MRRHAIAGLAAILLVAVGCGDEEPHEELVDIAVKQEKQQQDIEQIASKIDGIERALQGIRKSLAGDAPPSETRQPKEASERQPASFSDTPEYEQIAARLSGIQQQLNLMQSQVVEMGEDLLTRRERELLAKRDEREKAMKERPELSAALELLVQNFADNLVDPARRREFDLDMEELKESLSQLPTLEAFREYVLGGLRNSLQTAKDRSERDKAEEEIQSLESASGDELAAKLQGYRPMISGRYPRDPRFDRSYQLLMELAKEYDIPEETVRDSGLPSMLIKFQSQGRAR